MTESIATNAVDTLWCCTYMSLLLKEPFTKVLLASVISPNAPVTTVHSSACEMMDYVTRQILMIHSIEFLVFYVLKFSQKFQECSQQFIFFWKPKSNTIFNNGVGKNNNNKITINSFLFLLSFRIVSSRHSHNYIKIVKILLIVKIFRCVTSLSILFKKYW